MILRITDSKDSQTIDEQRLSIEEFNDILCHPWIRCNEWSEVIVDLDDRLNLGFLRQLFNLNQILKFKRIKDSFSSKDVLILISLYPDYAAKFMDAKKEGQESLLNVYNEVASVYGWT